MGLSSFFYHFLARRSESLAFIDLPALDCLGRRCVIYFHVLARMSLRPLPKVQGTGWNIAQLYAQEKSYGMWLCFCHTQKSKNKSRWQFYQTGQVESLSVHTFFSPCLLFMINWFLNSFKFTVKFLINHLPSYAYSLPHHQYPLPAWYICYSWWSIIAILSLTTIVHSRALFWNCTFCELRQTYSDII